MRIVKDYETAEEREAILAQMKQLGVILVEEQSHFDGKHLIFNDNKIPRDYGAEIDELKRELKTKGVIE